MHSINGARVGAFVVLGLGVCALVALAEPADDAPYADKPNPAPFETELLDSIEGFEEWGRATDDSRSDTFVALAACTIFLNPRPPISNPPPTFSNPPPPIRAVQMSNAGRSSLHAGKVFHLHVRLPQLVERVPSISGLPPEQWYRRVRKTYSPQPISPQPVGQMLVKQSFCAEAVDYDKAVMTDPMARIFPELRRETLDGHAINHKTKQAYRAGEERELFVMLKLDPATPGTDQGWVYGVLTPDGKNVLQSGLIESCMDCHIDAEHDRLFGLEHAAK